MKFSPINEHTKLESYMIWRKRNGITLEDVAKYINCSISILSRWEHGKRGLNPYKIKKYNEFIQKKRKE